MDSCILGSLHLRTVVCHIIIFTDIFLGFSECVRSVRNHNDVIKSESCVCVRVNRLNARQNRKWAYP